MTAISDGWLAAWVALTVTLFVAAVVAGSMWADYAQGERYREARAHEEFRWRLWHAEHVEQYHKPQAKRKEG